MGPEDAFELASREPFFPFGSVETAPVFGIFVDDRDPAAGFDDAADLADGLLDFNRVLQALQREGLIERDRRMVQFVSWERMRDVADFNPRYLHTREFVAAAADLS